MEGESEPEYVTKEEHEELRGRHEALRTEHDALEERVKACECNMVSRSSGSEEVAVIRSATIPEPPRKVQTTAKNFREFVRE